MCFAADKETGIFSLSHDGMWLFSAYYFSKTYIRNEIVKFLFTFLYLFTL
jgi:hypothetical protein